MKSYSEISTRYIKQNRKRTVLTILGITLATILLFAIGTFILSFKDAMIERAKKDTGDFEFQLNNLSSEEAEKVINNAEIKNTAIERDSNTIYILQQNQQRQVGVVYVDKGYYERIYTSKLVQGRIPAASDEIIIDTYNTKNLNVKLGDTLTLTTKGGDNKKFKIVGVAQPEYYRGISIYSYFDSTKLESDYKYNLSINLKSEKHKQQIVQKIISQANIKVNDDTKQDNSQLLYLTQNGGNQFKAEGLEYISIFVIGMIMLSTIIVIYNSFNISVIERMRYFGILKAIGATPKQIKRIVFKEGFIMGIIALPLGCLIGFLSLKYGIKLFIGDKLVYFDNFKVGFYPIIILITAVLVSVTIFLSLIGPARKAKRVSAVDAMRNKNEIKLGKLKRRKGRIVSKLFGVEGSIAYKNIRRTPFRFIVTTLALTISIIMFNVFYGTIDYAKQSISQEFVNSSYEARLFKNDSQAVFSDKEIKELETKDFLKNRYDYMSSNIELVLNNQYVSQEYSSKTQNPLDDKTYKNYGYTKIEDGKVISGKVNELKISEKYIKSGKFDKEALRNGGVILLDGFQKRNKNGELETVRATNYKVGDIIKIPKIKKYTDYKGAEDKEITYEKWNQDRKSEISMAINKGEFYEFPIIAIADREPFDGYSVNGAGLIMNEDLYSKLMGKSEPTRLFFNFDNNSDRIKAVDYFQSTQAYTNYIFADMKSEVDHVNNIFSQIGFFVYCFIIIITIISIVNIFNTISTNLLLRKKEFSTLKAIGMTEKQLRKSVMLEGTLYGIIAAIFGGVISAILLEVIVKLVSRLAELQYKFDVVPFILSIVCAILITYLSTLAPLKRIKKLTIVEGISDEE